MHERTLPLALLIAAGCAGSEPAPAVIEDFVERSTPVRCEPIPHLGEGEVAVEEIRSAGDTLLLALDAVNRRVLLYGHDLRLRRTVRFAEHGPTGVAEPVSAVLAGDSLLYIADRTGRALKLLDLEGRDRGTIRLPFPPFSLGLLGDEPIVTAMALGLDMPRIAYRVERGRPRPLDVPIEPFPDHGVQTLANLALAEPVSATVTAIPHRMMVPRLYLVDGSDGGSVRARAVPISDGVRQRLGFVPSMPVREEEFDRILVPLISITHDPANANLLYLTFTGRKHGNRTERAIVRVGTAGPRLEYLRSYVLDVAAARMAYLPADTAVLTVDIEDRWFRCPTPL